MFIFNKIALVIFTLTSTSALAAFKCSDQTYTLTLSESRPGVPPKVNISPSIVYGGGTTVGTYRFTRTYPLWSDKSKDKVEYIQPGVFGGFVSIEGWGLQRIELLCSDVGGKNPDKSTYSSISNIVTWESKKGDFQSSLKEGDLIEEYPSSGRNLYRYKSGKLVPIPGNQGELNQIFHANLDNIIRAPSQVITPIAVAAPSSNTNNNSSSATREPTSTVPTEEDPKTTKLSCAASKKAEIKLRYQETARVLDLLYKQKKSDLGCD